MTRSEEMPSVSEEGDEEYDLQDEHSVHAGGDAHSWAAVDEVRVVYVSPESQAVHVHALFHCRLSADRQPLFLRSGGFLELGPLDAFGFRGPVIKSEIFLK